MAAVFRKKSEIEKRLKNIRKEISSVNSNLSSLSRTVMDSEESSVRPRVRAGAARGKRKPKGARSSDRFADYFSTSFQPVLPLRRERRIQRNKAIVMSVFVLMVLFWIVYRFFL